MNKQQIYSNDSSHGTVYVIKSRQGQIYKIGFTRDWNRRSRQLEVGKKADTVKLFFVRDPEDVEKKAHKHWDCKRLPQSEWFALDNKELDELLELIQSVSLQNESEWEKKIENAKKQRRAELEREQSAEQQQRSQFYKSHRSNLSRKSSSEQREYAEAERKRMIQQYEAKSRKEFQSKLVAIIAFFGPMLLVIAISNAR